MGGKNLSNKEIKEVGLLILDEIDRVSKILGLKYYLAYGTLLGAIRHNGYIPWDDDVDIWMKRKDFNIFLEKFNQLCSSDFKLLSWLNDEDYPSHAPKVVYLKTEVREKWIKKRAKDLGVWVDIFCLSYISDQEWSSGLQKEMRSLELCRHASRFRYMCFISKITLIEMLVKNRKEVSFDSIKKKPSEYIARIYTKMSGAEEGDTFIPIDCLLIGGRELSAKWFDKIMYHDFEDRKYPVPCEYDLILKKIYGDYMCLPSQKERRQKQHLAYVRWK